MEADIRIYDTAAELAKKLAVEIQLIANDFKERNKALNIAISGGNTPKILFNTLVTDFSTSIPWSTIHFFFVDERCVPKDHPESNYGMCFQNLFSKLPIPTENIHRMRGESEPQAEAERYAGEVKKHLPIINDLPIFDITILGLGEDGHTASIFPDQMNLLQSERICEVAIHPQSGQKRITLTGKIINSSGWIVFLVIGSNKSRIARAVINERKRFYPAANIKAMNGKLSWFLDKSVSRGL